MPEPAYPMRVILNIFMSDHDTGILPLQMHANRKEKKRKEKNTPFVVNLMRSQVLYRAAQNARQ